LGVFKNKFFFLLFEKFIFAQLYYPVIIVFFLLFWNLKRLKIANITNENVKNIIFKLSLEDENDDDDVLKDIIILYTSHS
jgi:hypothetical protein